MGTRIKLSLTLTFKLNRSQLHKIETKDQRNIIMKLEHDYGIIPELYMSFK